MVSYSAWRALLVAATSLFLVWSVFPSPAPAMDLAVGASPYSVAVGDFNGDGHLDLAVANGGSNDVSVLLGNGDGTFTPARNFDAGLGGGPLWVAVGDFNLDRKLDLVVANSSSDSVGVLLGNGDGTFGSPQTFTFAGDPESIAIWDFNGDGKPDLAVANDDTAGTVAVLLGSGGGNFQPAQTFQVGGSNSESVAAGDFNGDGRLDVAVANAGSNTVSVLLGNGDGIFQAARTFAVGMKPEFVVAGDVNGDGILDLAVGNHNSGTVTVLLGNGNGTFGPGSLTTLSVVLAGTGHGTVTSSETPPQINCGTTCSASYSTGTVVTLTAQAAAGSTFAGWSNCDTVSNTTCTVTMNASRSVTATFNPQGVALTVMKAGTGSGAVTSSETPPKIDCEATCGAASASYDSGTVVTLTAAPASGSTFGSWSGCDTVSGSSCTVTMNAARSVTATFNAQRFTLTVAEAGTGSGTVTSSPAGIDCGTSCSADYASGTLVTLTAAASAGSTFTGWSGGCSGTGDCMVSLTANAAVTASFAGVGVSAPVLRWQYGGCSPQYCDTGWHASPVVADLDGNGQPAVIWGSYDVVALNGADGSLKWRGPSNNRVWPSIAVADLTGNGTLEVVVACASDQLTVYDRCGGVMWTRSPSGGVENRPTFENSAPVIADVDGDGVPELIVVGDVYNCATNVSLYHVPFILKLDRTRWSGSGFDWTVLPTPGADSAPRSQDWNVIEFAVPNPAVADLDGDGFKEIIYPSYDGKVHAYWLDKTEHGNWP